MLTVERLKDLLDYDPDTGQFIRIAVRAHYAGTVAGTVTYDGYSSIQIDRKHYQAHRLAWLYVYGYWPKKIDHINGIPDDNRIDNLREADDYINNQNQRKAQRKNKTGYLGVSPTSDGRFQATIVSEGKKKHLGRFTTPIEAHEAYVKAKRVLHPGCTI